MATSAALLALALLQTVSTTDPSTETAPPKCHGPTIGQMAEKLQGAQHFEFPPSLLEPFLGLWAEAQQPPLPDAPDSVTVFAGPPDLPLVLLYGHAGCALAMLKAERADLWRALRAGIGPAV